MLGYRYVWVDLFCIVQDSMEDKTTEISRMADYSTNADILFASTTNHMDGPLLPSSQELDISCLKLVSASCQASTETFSIGVRPSLKPAERVLRDSVINRAWRLQEAMLPRRLVLFGEEQVYWTCGRGLRAQSSTSILPHPLLSVPEFKRRVTALSDHAPRSLKIRYAYDYWFYIATVNAAGKLTMLRDRLPSVAGLAAVLTDTTTDTITAGLWKGDLARGLLWYGRGSSDTHGHGKTGAPSWSWASAAGPISYSLASGISDDALQDLPTANDFTVLDCVGGDEQRGIIAAKEGFLLVSGRAKLGSQLDVATLGSFEYFFDDLSVHTDHGVADVLQTLMFLLVAPWTYNLRGGRRWAGLLIEAVHREKHTIHVRRGLFLGPKCSTDVSQWQRQELKLV